MCAVVLSGALFLYGCAWRGQSAASSQETKLVIPDCPSAKEQYGFALVYQRSQLLSPEESRKKEQLAKIRQCFERVVANYPNDPVYAARADLEIADCYSKSGDRKKAIEIYSAIVDKYAGNDYAQARALYSMARTHDFERRHEEAKAIYRQVMDQFGNSQTQSVKDIVKRSQAAYYQIKEQPPGGTHGSD